MDLLLGTLLQFQSLSSVLRSQMEELDNIRDHWMVYGNELNRCELCIVVEE